MAGAGSVIFEIRCRNSMNTPVSLLERLRLPTDQSAWNRFVRLYTPMIFAWCRRAGLQPDDAADLVQEVLTTLVLKLPEFQLDGRGSFRAWLKTVTLNKWRDRARRLAARPHSGGETLAEVPAPPADSFSEIEYRQYLVSRALELMQAEFQPTTWRACWELVVNSRSAAEIARELGISENAVYLAKGRVLRYLRRELAGLWE
jgi:RNA polymerase sigma-70 factor (ECF subfamily)